jgi:hypothetical protein
MEMKVYRPYAELREKRVASADAVYALQCIGLIALFFMLLVVCLNIGG